MNHHTCVVFCQDQREHTQVVRNSAEAENLKNQSHEVDSKILQFLDVMHIQETNALKHFLVFQECEPLLCPPIGSFCFSKQRNIAPFELQT